ncbi:hypothetical protein H5410_027395, partial [Solanum commersonii]
MVPRCSAISPKVQSLKMLKVKNLIERQYFLSFEDLKIFISKKLEVVANTTLTLCFWLAREKGFKTKITESMVGGYWV